MTSKPFIFAALGARGTGKSAWVKQQLARLKPARLAVWDLMQEHDAEATDDLAAFVRALRARRFRLAFHPSRDDRQREREFELWCRAMLAAGDVLCVVEELAFVTTPSRAPAAWREMTLLGRHERHRLSIIGTSQRPASIDKDFLANADVVHCGRLAYKPDAIKAGEVLGVPAEELLTLPDLHWRERRAGDTAARAGVLTFGPSQAGAGRARRPTQAAKLTGSARAAESSSRP